MATGDSGPQGSPKGRSARGRERGDGAVSPAPAAPHEEAPADRAPHESPESEIERAYEAGRAAWPKLALDRRSFEQHVRERLDDAPAGARAADLYLACACVRGVPGAFDAFERRYLAGIGAAVRGIDPAPGFADDVRQLLWDKLFASTKLADYSGRGSLESWVAVAAQRIALSVKRRERARAGVAPGASFDDLADPGADPERAYLRGRYRPEVQAALAAALAVLSERERMIMRLNLVGGASLARIGAMYRVNQSTVSRWAAGARERVLVALRRELRARLGVKTTEVESLLRMVRSDFHISLSRVLDDGD